MSELANARAVLEERRATGALPWAGPATMLFARSIFAVIAAGLVAALMALNGSATPWRDAALWFPVYASGGLIERLLKKAGREDPARGAAT